MRRTTEPLGPLEHSGHLHISHVTQQQERFLHQTTHVALLGCWAARNRLCIATQMRAASAKDSCSRHAQLCQPVHLLCSSTHQPSAQQCTRGTYVGVGNTSGCRMHMHIVCIRKSDPPSGGCQYGGCASFSIAVPTRQSPQMNTQAKTKSHWWPLMSAYSVRIRGPLPPIKVVCHIDKGW